MGIFDKFKKGFQKSASAFSSGLKEIIVKKEIDDENLNKIEEFLIQSDVGIEAASEIKEIISTKKVDPNKDLTSEINLILKEYNQKIKQYNGKVVTLMGYMFPLEQSEKQKNFLLGPYPLSCPFHYHVGPSQVIEINSDQAIDFSFDPVTVKGELKVKFNKETGIFYYLELKAS